MKARLDNHDISINDITSDLMSYGQQQYFHSEDIGEDFISFEYKRNGETKNIVDIIGSMIKNHLALMSL